MEHSKQDKAGSTGSSTNGGRTRGSEPRSMDIREGRRRRKRKALAKAMGDEAWKTVKNSEGFTPKEAPHGQAGERWLHHLGQLTAVSRSGRSAQVAANFTIWVDGTFSIVAPLGGRGSSEGSAGAEDALRGVTEGRIKTSWERSKRDEWRNCADRHRSRPGFRHGRVPSQFDINVLLITLL